MILKNVDSCELCWRLKFIIILPIGITKENPRYHDPINMAYIGSRSKRFSIETVLYSCVLIWVSKFHVKSYVIPDVCCCCEFVQSRITQHIIMEYDLLNTLFTIDISNLLWSNDPPSDVETYGCPCVEIIPE